MDERSKLEFITNANDEQIKRIFERVAEHQNLHVKFEPGSNPTINVYVGESMKNEENRNITTVGGITAADGSIVERSSVVFTTSDSKGVVDALKACLDSVSVDRRSEVEQAINTLATPEELTKSELVEAVETVADGSSLLRRKLEEIATGATGSLAAAGLIGAMRFVIGV